MDLFSRCLLHASKSWLMFCILPVIAFPFFFSLTALFHSSGICSDGIPFRKHYFSSKSTLTLTSPLFWDFDRIYTYTFYASLSHTREWTWRGQGLHAFLFYFQSKAQLLAPRMCFLHWKEVFLRRESVCLKSWGIHYVKVDLSWGTQRALP